MAMYIRETLEFSVFPSMLLITTLFRLGLNISSTRKILFDNGYAGQVVKTFGEFVIRGNAIIGFIIFLIIVLVQFIVITKGSERVAEVAARFTLDAMPGKQMAIDADLNTGLIDEQEARIRRSKVQREADFFGSMDGATKFVKGDAIISIIITLINFIGGILVGTMNKQGSITEIMQIYTTSTIGDGLVSQIPALLISVATGMIVTRSASENSLSEEVTRQFLAQPPRHYDGRCGRRVPEPDTGVPGNSDTLYIGSIAGRRILPAAETEKSDRRNRSRNGGSGSDKRS